MVESSLDPRSREAAKHVNQLRFSLSLLRRNYGELTVAIRHLTAPLVAHEMSGLDDRWHRHEAMGEVLYLLHNYVASAKSLVDHTRRIYRKLYEPNGLIPLYQSQVDGRFVNDPLSQFVEDLREMSQHYRLPSISFSTSITMKPEGGVMTCRLQLLREDLREYPGWTVPAKKFLDTQSEKIDVLTLVQDYHAHMMGFHEWFKAEQNGLHGIGPALLERLTTHGVRSPEQELIEEVTRRVDALTARSRDGLTFSDLHNALVPALTILDSQRLNLCEHDAALWVNEALDAIGRRFSIPETLRDALQRLVSRDV